MHLTATGPLLTGTEVTNIDIEKSGVTHSTAIGVSVPFININPSNSSPCSSGLFLDDDMVIGGTFAQMSGCTQGFTFTRNNHLSGYVSITNTNPVLNEQMIVSKNYFEDYGFGVFATQGAAWLINNNTFAANPHGVSPNYQAIVLGSSTAPVGGSVVTGNVAFAFADASTNTMFYANMFNGSTFANNTVNGLVNESQCMSVGTNQSSPGGSPAVTVSGNTCWGAGTINLIGSTPLARGNEYYLTSSPQVMNKVELN